MGEVGVSGFLDSIVKWIVLWEIKSSIICYDVILNLNSLIFQVQSECGQCIRRPLIGELIMCYQLLVQED